MLRSSSCFRRRRPRLLSHLSNLKKKQRVASTFSIPTRSTCFLRGSSSGCGQSASNDLTIKLRPLGNEKPSVPSNIGAGFDCEIDLIGGAASPSYTARSKYTATHVPETGVEISSLLDAGQKKLLTEAQISVDWARVNRIADIRATSWQTKAQPTFRKLALELWEWPGGRILELSTKVGPDAGPSKYTELQRVVKTKGLSLNATQRAKTSMVLETLAHTAH